MDRQSYRSVVRYERCRESGSLPFLPNLGARQCQCMALRECHLLTRRSIPLLCGGQPLTKILCHTVKRKRSPYAFNCLTRCRRLLLISWRKVRFGSRRVRRRHSVHVHSNSELEGSARCPQRAHINQSPALCRTMGLNSLPSTQYGQRTIVFLPRRVSHVNKAAPSPVRGAAKTPRGRTDFQNRTEQAIR
jgi:hypothetical protein